MPYWAQMSVMCQERSEAVHTWYGLVALPLLPDTVISTALQRLASRGSTSEAFIVGHENESTGDQDFTGGPCLQSFVFLM